MDDGSDIDLSDSEGEEDDRKDIKDENFVEINIHSASSTDEECHFETNDIQTILTDHKNMVAQKIKSRFILYNTFDPIHERYVKKIWSCVEGQNGLVTKYIVWNYYRDCAKKSVRDVIKKLYYNGQPKIAVIYFHDDMEYRFMIKEYMINKISLLS